MEWSLCNNIYNISITQNRKIISVNVFTYFPHARLFEFYQQHWPDKITHSHALLLVACVLYLCTTEWLCIVSFCDLEWLNLDVVFKAHIILSFY